MSLTSKTIQELHSLYRSKKTSVQDVVEASLKRIEETNYHLNSFSHICRESALAEAKKLDAAGMPENASMMWGIPVGVKDNMCIKGLPATCGSKILKNYISPYDGAMGVCLKKAGSVVMGSCHMDEFAMGSSCENNAFVKVKNPYDLERVPGGSSGGSAAAVASSQVIVSLGSDTGGSIRQPASFCGVVGLKPTYGLVSRFGLVAFASSLDQIGPFARCVEDAAFLLQSIAGHDKKDSTSYDYTPPDYSKDLKNDIKGIKIGLPKEYFTDGIPADILTCIDKAKKVFCDLGAELVEISLPHTQYAIATYYILATAEASANLARFDGVRYGYRNKEAATLKELYIRSRSEGFGPEVKRRIITGTFVLSSGYYDAYYLKGQKVRTLVKQDFDQAFRKADVILTPTSPCTAFQFGEKIDDPISMYLSDIFTVSVNLAGLPGISLPCGTDDKKLPVGLQLIGPSLGEARLLNAAYQFEKVCPPLGIELKV
ncbi:MAG: Asp-tRNA(Asn)/Glu-tRNA(Gln) amidotransferase subunit GatA [Candidatus Aureabacteria bacterium]|nr:Asp-tRNA(Asn)/Glu-tRNA(Gln) amidotransferase subunit GatA [Candidatus Auribacterota bacterium]